MKRLLALLFFLAPLSAGATSLYSFPYQGTDTATGGFITFPNQEVSPLALNHLSDTLFWTMIAKVSSGGASENCSLSTVEHGSTASFNFSLPADNVYHFVQGTSSGASFAQNIGIGDHLFIGCSGDGSLTFSGNGTDPYAAINTDFVPSPASTTQITFVEPNATIPLGTTTALSLEAGGTLSAVDSAVDPFIQWNIDPLTKNCSSSLFFICPTNLLGSVSGRYFQSAPFVIVPNLPQSFDVSTTTNFAFFDATGVYVMRTSIRQHNSLFGVPLPDTIITSTSTLFTVATATPLDTNFLNYTASSTVCTTSFNFSDCTSLLFIPQTLPDVNPSLALMSRKPPLGYFSQAGNILGGLSTSTGTSTVAVSGILTVALFLSPLVNGLAGILWFLLLWWLFNRVRKFDFQS
jgi:hypothetical protein